MFFQPRRRQPPKEEERIAKEEAKYARQLSASAGNNIQSGIAAAQRGQEALQDYEETGDPRHLVGFESGSVRGRDGRKGAKGEFKDAQRNFAAARKRLAREKLVQAEEYTKRNERDGKENRDNERKRLFGIF